ncbi:MAG: hypothetical protein AAF597_10480, partial [Bacteroidota bacterium]
MRELEDILRRESHRELPATPPPGSFQQLRSKLQQPPIFTSRLRWLTVVTIGLGVTLVGFWWLMVPASLPSNAEPVKLTNALPPPSMPTAPTNDPESSVALPAVSPNPELGPSLQLPNLASESVGRSVTSVERVTAEVPVTSSTYSIPTTVEQFKDVGPIIFAPDSLPVTVNLPSGGSQEPVRPIESSTSRRKAQQYTLVDAPVLEFSAKVPSIGRVSPSYQALTGGDNISTTKLSVVPSPSQLRKLTPRWIERPAQRAWDVSLSYYGRQEGLRDQFSLRYADTDELNPGQPPQAIVIEEETRLLYYVGTEDYQVANRLAAVQLRINRLAQNGLRFGLGITFYRRGSELKPLR